MDRLYTCFVSSTYLDLVHERQSLVSNLLGAQCVPLGMEYFPSVGDNQWVPITENIDAADFCLFLIAGRYGSIEDGHDLSWTHREFRHARARNKPIIVLMHSDIGRLPMERCETDPDRRRALDAFRDEVADDTVCKFFVDEAGLVSGALQSIAAIKQRDDVVGWSRGAGTTTEESDFPHAYDHLEVDWAYRVAEADRNTLDGSYRAVREVRATTPFGLEHLTLDFGRSSDRQLPFSAENYPHLQLANFERPSGGQMTLRDPHRFTGAAFAQNVAFSPPLGQNESARFEITGELLRYKYRYAEDLMASTMAVASGPRIYDFISRRILYPTRDLWMSVFLADEIGARPLGPRIGRELNQPEHAEAARMVRDGRYSLEAAEHDGAPGIRMTMHVPSPQLRSRYRLAWELQSNDAAAATQ